MSTKKYPWEEWLDEQYAHIKPLESEGEAKEVYPTGRIVKADAVGQETNVEEIDLPLEIRKIVETAPGNHIIENYSRYLPNPDLWTEEDERSLMILGHLDHKRPTNKRVKRNKIFFDSLEDIS
jgi:hypothetical protein